MRPAHLAICTVAFVVVLAAPASAQTVAPPGWVATESQAKALIFDDKSKEAIALLDPVVKKNPKFADGHVWLGSAYESMGRAQARSDAVAALAALETAAAHFRSAFDLGGGTSPELTVRAFVDLLTLLRRTEERRKTIAAAVARFPAMPVAHWYAVTQALEEGTDVAIPMKAARTGIPQSDVMARLDYASYLVGLVDQAPAPARRALIAEANALCDEATKARPGDRRVTGEVTRIKGQLAIATTPVDRTQGPAADEASVQGALRTIASAQIMYSATCATGFYAPTLGVLGQAPAGGQPFLSADLAAGSGRVIERYGYRIEMTAPPTPGSPRSCNGVGVGGSAKTFEVVARPLAGRSGRSFRLDQEGNLTTIP